MIKEVASQYPYNYLSFIGYFCFCMILIKQSAKYKRRIRFKSYPFYHK